MVGVALRAAGSGHGRAGGRRLWPRECCAVASAPLGARGGRSVPDQRMDTPANRYCAPGVRWRYFTLFYPFRPPPNTGRPPARQRRAENATSVGAVFFLIFQSGCTMIIIVSDTRCNALLLRIMFYTLNGSTGWVHFRCDRKLKCVQFLRGGQ